MGCGEDSGDGVWSTKITLKTEWSEVCSISAECSMSDDRSGFNAAKSSNVRATARAG